MIDDGLVMQRVAGRVHALERAAGEVEALAVLRDDEAFARDRQDLAVQLAYSSSPYTARVPAMSFAGSIRCGAPRGCTTAVARGNARISAPAPPA